MDTGEKITWAVVPITRYSLVRYARDRTSFSVGECGQYGSEESAQRALGKILEDESTCLKYDQYPICFLHTDDDYRAVSEKIKNFPIGLIVDKKRRPWWRFWA